MPLVRGTVTGSATGKFEGCVHPDDIIQQLFKPFFEDRENLQNGIESWTVERIM